MLFIFFFPPSLESSSIFTTWLLVMSDSSPYISPILSPSPSNPWWVSRCSSSSETTSFHDNNSLFDFDKLLFIYFSFKLFESSGP